ncbi:MAG TPA: NAD(P)H-dependent oxidoreductase [Caulobacteraceae bacterium]|jgi:FMN-dependent NADH-azoreductase|nr:NAD(P)H-dependent oxidoreductase [Caulobacteraceae bacterium]
MKILHIDSSINAQNSVTRDISRTVVERLTTLDPSAHVIYRDLGAWPLPHFTLDAFADTSIVDEFLDADVVVIGAPMYNFGVPSQLKAWLDRIAIVGKTFRYTEKGPEGLAGGRRVIVASSRGGYYGAGTPTAAFEHQESHLRAFFGLLGLADLEFVHAEGVNIGPEVRGKAIEAARGEALKLAA